jgi:hypothetical protein
LQPNCSQGGGYSPLAWGEHCTRQKQPDMLSDAFGEQWRKRSQNPYHLGG